MAYSKTDVVALTVVALLTVFAWTGFLFGERWGGVAGSFGVAVLSFHVSAKKRSPLLAMLGLLMLAVGAIRLVRL